MAVVNILKALIGKEDLNIGSGTFTRRTSSGSTQSMTKIDQTSFYSSATESSETATPSVEGLSRVLFSNATATTVTSLLNGAAGQVLIVEFSNNNTTLGFSGTLLLAGLVDFLGNTGDVVVLFYNGTAWVETSRTTVAFPGYKTATPDTLDSSPSVENGISFLVTANAGHTSIVTFDDGKAGQRVILEIDDANTTLVHSSTFVLAGSTNVLCADGDVFEFFYTGSVWLELSRTRLEHAFI